MEEAGEETGEVEEYGGMGYRNGDFAMMGSKFDTERGTVMSSEVFTGKEK